MKKQITLKLIALSLILIIGGCESRFYSPIVIVNDRVTINEFSIENGVKATIEEGRNGNESKIILILPPDYQLDYIVPNIIVSDSTKGITPKSGEKVVFESQRPIEYRLFDNKGNAHYFYLYVRRADKLKVQLITKEWNLDKIDQNGYVKLEVEAILGKVGTTNGTTLIFFDKLGNKVNQLNEYKPIPTITTNNFYINPSNPFPKAGEYKVKIIQGLRESDEFPFLIKNGNAALIPKAYLYPRFLKNEKIIIKGFNFNQKNKYKVKFSNDFINSAIEVPFEFIDENSLSLYIPSSFEDSDYDVSFLENDVVIDSKITQGMAVKTNDNNQFNIQIAQISNNGAVISLLPQDSYTKGDEIKSFTICCGQSLKGKIYGLKLVNNNDIYKITGEIKFGGASGNSWISFKINDNIPKGSYAVYGIVDDNESLRYRKKIEIK